MPNWLAGWLVGMGESSATNKQNIQNDDDGCLGWQAGWLAGWLAACQIGWLAGSRSLSQPSPAQPRAGQGESSAKKQKEKKTMMMPGGAQDLDSGDGWLAPDHSPSPAQPRPGQGESSAKKQTKQKNDDDAWRGSGSG